MEDWGLFFFYVGEPYSEAIIIKYSEILKLDSFKALLGEIRVP